MGRSQVGQGSVRRFVRVSAARADPGEAYCRRVVRYRYMGRVPFGVKPGRGFHPGGGVGLGGFPADGPLSVADVVYVIHRQVCELFKSTFKQVAAQAIGCRVIKGIDL